MSSESTQLGSHRHRVGLVLSGGGARGAYQAGVVKAIGEIAADLGMKHPIPIITGVSAGSVNASYLASRAEDFVGAAAELADMWSRVTADNIFRTDAFSAGRSGLRFITDAAIGAFYTKKLARSLLDSAPFGPFLKKHTPFERIAENIKKGHLEALAITAMNYSNAISTTFVQSVETAPMWHRSRRRSERAEIREEHVMASAAIPIFFPPVRVGKDDYGDGCLRNTAPLSPAIHLGADRLLVISVRRPDNLGKHHANLEPSLARVLGVVLNALLLDAIDVDMERMSRVNQTVEMVAERFRSHLQLRKVDYLWIRPTTDIGALAGDLFEHLPRVIRYLMGGLGSSLEASELTSYLLFDPEFCGRLVENGYNDGLANRAAIAGFLSGEPVALTSISST